MITYFDENYFDGETEAGMNGYHRSPVKDPSIPLTYADEFGERHWFLYQKHREFFDDKTVLFVGCAKGFDVQDFRELGIEAYGIDVSAYAISKASEDIRSYVAVDDLMNLTADDLMNYDMIVGLRVLPCLSNDQLVSFSANLALSGCESVFLVDTLETYTPSEVQLASENYNVKTLSEWKLLFPSSNIYSYRRAGNSFE